MPMAPPDGAAITELHNAPPARGLEEILKVFSVFTLLMVRSP